MMLMVITKHRSAFFFFSSRRRHTRLVSDWSSDVCSSDLIAPGVASEQSGQSKRGGKRPGAGRKPNLAKLLLKGFSKNTLAEAVANVDVGAVVTSLLKSKKEIGRASCRERGEISVVAVSLK